MQQVIEHLLRERAAQLSARIPRRLSIGLSAAVHVLIVSGILIGPLLAARPNEPIEFVAVQIVPLQALGVPEPVSRQRQEAPPVQPEATVSEEKEREPEREAALPLPEPEPVKKTPGPPAERRSQPVRTDGDAGSAESGREQRIGSPTGSSLGTSAFGASVGGFDNPDFVYSYYVDQMLAMISANWLRPSIGGQVEAIVHFRIHRDGQISDMRIATSSGYNSFDLAGLRAVQLAAPFPKLPQSFRHDSLGVNLILR